jgi:TolB protein
MPLVALLFVSPLLTGEARAKIYIDIVSAPRRLPIAIQDLQGPSGAELTAIVSDDLAFSGVFLPLDHAAFIEHPAQEFRAGNWTGTGAEAVVKGFVSMDTDGLVVSVLLYDVFEGTLIMEKKYRAQASLVRPLAHTIAGDIYTRITGRHSMFRTKIAYIAEEGGRHVLTRSDWDGHRKRSLGVTAAAMLAPHWSQDGRRLLYSAQRGRGWSVYLLDFRERKERKVFSSPGLNMAGDFFPSSTSFSLSASRDGSPDIYTFDIQEKKLRKLTTERGIEVSPSVSSDGERIAYVSDRGGNPHIYTMDKFGYNKARVTFEGKYNTSPAWSPRGDRLVFSGRHEGRNHIFLIRPDGTGLEKLTDVGNNEEPSFSPDGRFIAFTSDRDGKKGVYIMRADGEAQRRISPPGIKAFGPAWSSE